MEKLYQTSLYTDRQGFRIEDMYYNGIIRLKAGIELRPTVGKNGRKERFCDHIMDGNKYAIISHKIRQYERAHRHL